MQGLWAARENITIFAGVIEYYKPFHFQCTSYIIFEISNKSGLLIQNHRRSAAIVYMCGPG